MYFLIYMLIKRKFYVSGPWLLDVLLDHPDCILDMRTNWFLQIKRIAAIFHSGR